MQPDPARYEAYQPNESIRIAEEPARFVAGHEVMEANASVSLQMLPRPSLKVEALFALTTKHPRQDCRSYRVEFPRRGVDFVRSGRYRAYPPRESD